MASTDERVIRRFPEGIVWPPASKSLLHRAVICAALAEGRSLIHNVTISEDIEATLGGVRALGANWRLDGRTLCIDGGGERRSGAIDCKESGSTLRFLIPVAAMSGQGAIFEGKGRLLERPMGAYASAFRRAGVAFQHSPDGIKVGGPLRGGIYTLPGDVSSQFVSGLLLALPLAAEDSEIRLESPLESRQYAEMTMDVMAAFGVSCEAAGATSGVGREAAGDVSGVSREAAGDSFRVRGGQRYTPSEYTVEADFSQAAYFLAAAALGRDVACAGLSAGSRQGDIAILRILEGMGAEIRWGGGQVSARADRLKGASFDARENPDLVPPVAALCCFCEGESRIVNAGRLRLKESDRLSALAQGLSRLGADISEAADSLTIRGAPELKGGATVDAHNDHRIAMAMALAAIRCKNPVRLTGWRSVQKSYPDFWRDFEKTPQ
ncbi:MAG: 3-phosphoshikimate 1-carboxyvinyltransferase, partial [Clostridiales Family XIII bacterium]|nr:3-phosphoshikimate 1-carboxyvinyltransferase [Clostridiales Family XIII bacterium]